MQPGDVVGGRFEVERLAGSGGMGSIYMARDRLEGRPVALKLLSLGAGEAAGRRFEREATLLGTLAHPGIVRYVAHGREPGGRAFLAMEWLEGVDLSSVQRMGAADALGLVGRAGAAVGHAHARGIVHRDLKPQNIFLVGSRVDDVRVLDFGVAHAGVGAPSLTRTGMLVGTPGYMSPEQARGEPVDARTDVFALGCVLYELCSGRRAFGGPSPAAVLAKVVFHEPPRLSEVAPEASAGIEDLCARMLSKDPARRPPDGAAVAREAETLARGDGTSATGTPTSIFARASLGTEERRLVSVVMAAGGAGSEGEGETMSATAWREASGSRIAFLLDGSAVAVLAGEESATDLAGRAARAALALRRSLGRVPMAVATGRADVGGRLPVGEVIDRAVALAREGGGVAIDEVTAGLLGPDFEVRGDVLLAQREAAAEVRTLLGRPTTTVGRTQELGILEAAVAGCIEESVARAVLVTGPPGIGKSRLRWELLRRLARRADPVAVWIGRGDQSSAGSPFGLAADALRRQTNVQVGEPLEASHRKILSRVARRVPETDRRRVAEFLGELLGAPFPADESVPLRTARGDAMVMAEQVRRAVEDLVDAEAAVRPLVVVLEDLQWGDRPTVDLVDRMLRNLSARPLVFLALARPEVRDLFPGLWAEREVTELRLGRLSARASEALVREVLGADLPEDRVHLLVERSDGNAFFLEEAVRAAAEGRWEGLPATALAMVAARLEGLEPEARRLLRAASVFGERFWRGGALELLGGEQDASEASGWLDILVTRELLVRRAETRFPGEVEYVFRHALVREAAYGMLTEADAMLGHRLAAQWLEAAGEKQAIAVAEHLDRAGARTRAALWYLRAAGQALEGTDLQAAVDRAERAVTSGAAGEHLGRARLLQAEAYSWRGEHAEAERSAVEALDLLPSGTARWCHAARWAAVAAGRLGRADTVDAVAARLGSVRPDSDARVSYLTAAAYVALGLHLLGRAPAADVLLAEVEQEVGELTRADAALAALVHQARAWRAVLSGDAGRHFEERDAALGAIERAADVRGACTARVHLACARIELGKNQEAEAELRAALADATRMGLHTVAATARTNLGLALSRLGRFEEARATGAEAVEAFRVQGNKRMEGGARVYLAWAHELAGGLAGAEVEARAAIDLLASVPPLLPQALATLGRVLLGAGRVDEALDTARDAMELMSEGNIEEGEALVRLVHAEALEAASRGGHNAVPDPGDRDAARTAIAEAVRRLEARASRISNPALRSSFLDLVPEHARTLELAGAWLDEKPRS